MFDYCVDIFLNTKTYNNRKVNIIKNLLREKFALNLCSTHIGIRWREHFAFVQHIEKLKWQINGSMLSLSKTHFSKFSFKFRTKNIAEKKILNFCIFRSQQRRLCFRQNELSKEGSSRRSLNSFWTCVLQAARKKLDGNTVIIS